MNSEQWEAQNPIARWRLRRGKTQHDIAVATDSANSLVRDWEKGRVFPGWEKVKSLAVLMERDAAGLEHALRKWWIARPVRQEASA